MNKDTIIKDIASNYGLTKKDAESIVNSVFEEIISELEKGNVVRIADFGKFEVKTRIPRVGVNPITKEPLPIKGLNAVTYHASQSLRDRINKDR